MTTGRILKLSRPYLRSARGVFSYFMTTGRIFIPRGVCSYFMTTRRILHLSLPLHARTCCVRVCCHMGHVAYSCIFARGVCRDHEAYVAFVHLHLRPHKAYSWSTLRVFAFCQWATWNTCVHTTCTWLNVPSDGPCASDMASHCPAGQQDVEGTQVQSLFLP